MKKKSKKKQKKWLVPKSIKFDEEKLRQAKDKDLLRELPKMCRKQLDIILHDAEQRN